MSSVTPLRIALIGCGFIGRRHMENVLAMQDVLIEAVADTRAEAAQAFQKEFGAGYATTDAEKIFGDKNVDAVIICTHHDSHTPLALQAATAGKHILLEKPMALRLEECHRISAMATEANIVLSLNFKFRFAPAVLKTRELIQRPIVSLGQLCMERIPDENWVRDPIRGGGLILATGCHVLDMIYWLNNSEPVRVYAEGKPERPQDECNVDAVCVTVRFANGSVASLVLSDAGENAYVGKWLHEVFDGERSAVLYEHFRRVRFSGVEPSHYECSNEMLADGTYSLLEDFVSSIRTGRQPLTTGRDGVRATLLGLKILESLRTGDPQEVRLRDLD